ncbi:uncharacterized protein LOC122963069 [Acropora millepora]|uniref:uncharacterized protein LOC122963069 n=1 Tax=Acropora millepora TaxID=45264 RepID=UPI001CF0ED64|nr:uncharacterized protein LOC122963069 [Acropora millepora]
MSSLIGILVDVSGSMRNNAGSEVNEERVNWARSIFKVVDELIKHDVESSNQTFAVALGCPFEPQVFDLLGTARVATEEARGIKDLSSRKELRELINEALDILERNEAVRVRKWGKMDVLLDVLDQTTAAAILYYLQRRPFFTKRFVFECLPPECREIVVRPRALASEVSYLVMGAVPLYSDYLQEWASESSVREAIDKGKKLMEEIRRGLMVAVNKAAIMSVQSASEILHNSIDEKDEEKVEARHIKDLSRRKELRELIDETLDTLKRNGAMRVETWATMRVLLKVLDNDTAAAILFYLQRRDDFARRFVFECLPQDCREVPPLNLQRLAKLGFWAMSSVLPPDSSALPPDSSEPLQGWASESSVREAMEKGKQLLAEIRSERTIRSVQSASDILHKSTGKKELDKKRVDELLKAVEPYIYGRTPLMQAMHHSVDLFSHSQFANQKKLLFILSDGQPADGRDPPVLQLSDLGVTIVCCFITREGLSDPRRLYSLLDESWEAPAKFMFNMSSIVTTQNIPKKKGWKIDIENNETRLFFQVNHPDVIKEVSDMARKCVLTQDALSGVLSSVDLDLYINRTNDDFRAKKQQGKTCYANASAAVMHLAMKRIIGRDGGYPEFFDLRDRLIAKYGKHGESTEKVLKEICPEYRLRCRTVDANGAMRAICENRPVVVTFHWTGAQWDQFKKFYKYRENSRRILTRSYLDSRRYSTSAPRGHAVVLTSYDADSFRLMNSWRDDWADHGFFRVQKSDVLGFNFFDVFWAKDDLTGNEKKAYKQHGADVAGKLLKSLKGLHEVKYKCPSCAVESKVVDFSGHLLKAKCPACGRTFNANEEGGDLALNLYLTSLIHDDKSQ